MNRSNNNINEGKLEETIIERNTCIYDLNDTHILKVGNTVINIENVLESGIVIAFENERNHVLMRVGCIEMKIVSMTKVRYFHPNNPKLINTLDCS